MPSRTPTRSCAPQRIDLPWSPVEVAARLRPLPGFFFLDTATSEPEVDLGLARSQPGCVSIIGARPDALYEGGIHSDADRLRAALAEIDSATGADWGLPCGGLFGSIDFDGRYCFGRYRDLLIYRHDCASWFAVGGALTAELRAEAPGAPVAIPQLQFSKGLGRGRFCAMVRRAKDYIAAGDIYQVNLAQRFRAEWPAGGDAFPLYRRLRQCSPAPYAAFMELGGRQLLSSSPECFLALSGPRIVTRPIKGTRPRRHDAGEDERSAYELMTSPKEIAELVMITDLERNDLGQVCEFGSVRVAELVKLERFAQVFHLVSTIEGRLRDDVDHVGALQACFPGGSISGAPKRRALEIIAELEPEPRGLYTGVIGYLGAGGESAFNIAIRTACVADGELSLHTGAGIVADSDPDAEFEETLHKAAGVFAAAGISPRH